MRMATITALGLILVSGSAWAQSGFDGRERGGGYGYRDQADRSSSDDRHHWERGGDWDRDRAGSGKHTPARGASLYLKSGDKEFRVDCGDDDSTRECVDAALLMFREMHNAATSSPHSTSTPSPGGAAPSPGSSSGSSIGR